MAHTMAHPGRRRINAPRGSAARPDAAGCCAGSSPTAGPTTASACTPTAISIPPALPVLSRLSTGVSATGRLSPALSSRLWMTPPAVGIAELDPTVGVRPQHDLAARVRGGRGGWGPICRRRRGRRRLWGRAQRGGLEDDAALDDRARGAQRRHKLAVDGNLEPAGVPGRKPQRRRFGHRQALPGRQHPAGDHPPRGVAKLDPAVGLGAGDARCLSGAREHPGWIEAVAVRPVTAEPRLRRTRDRRPSCRPALASAMSSGRRRRGSGRRGLGIDGANLGRTLSKVGRRRSGRAMRPASLPPLRAHPPVPPAGGLRRLQPLGNGGHQLLDPIGSGREQIPGAIEQPPAGRSPPAKPPSACRAPPRAPGNADRRRSSGPASRA